MAAAEAAAARSPGSASRKAAGAAAAAQPDLEAPPHLSAADPKPVSYLGLFRYAEPVDWMMMSVGTIFSVANGAACPAFTILFADFSNVFGSSAAAAAAGSAPSPGGFMGRVTAVALPFLYLAAATLVASYFQGAMWTWAGFRQTNRIRMKFLHAVLRQDIAFFDVTATTGALLAGLNDDHATLQAAISERVGTFLQQTATFVIGLCVAFWRGWDMSLVMVACLPLLAGVGVLLSRLATSSAAKTSAAYAKASGVAQQAISQMRTVAAYNGQARAAAEYEAALQPSFRMGVRLALQNGLGIGAINGVIYLVYAAAFWYGSTRRVVIAGAYDGGQVVLVLVAALLGGFALGQATPIIQNFGRGRAAAAKIFDVIDRRPSIDPEDPRGEELPDVSGHVRLESVRFAYPSRPDVTVFEGFSLDVPAGQTVALVGESGSGKSTVVGLIERFYDPQQGRVLLDGVDIRTLRLLWLRQQIGLVSQEPALFATTIYENIAMGKDGCTKEEVEAAARAANAHRFISDLPKGFRTHAGERGLQLSGGQKQRVAIARAILKNPKILLLDEATSALDTQSERIVQDALNRMIGGGRTTLVVAHRLSTVRNADCIAVVRQGRVVESGTHDELLSNPLGAYTTLVKIQVAKRSQQEAAAGGGGSSGRAKLPAAAAVAAAVIGGGGVVDPAAAVKAEVVDDDEERRPRRGDSSGGGGGGSGGSDDDLLQEVAAYEVDGGEGGGQQHLGEAAAATSAAGAATTAASSAAKAAARFSVSWNGTAAVKRGTSTRTGEAAGTVKSPSPSAAASGGGGAEEVEGDEAASSPGCCGGALRSNRHDASSGGKYKLKGNAKDGEDDEEEEGEGEEKVANVPFSRLFSLNRPQWPHALVGMTASAGAGAIQPVFAFIFSSILASFYNPDKAAVRDSASRLCAALVGIGAGGFLATLAQQYCFGVMGQHLALRVRTLMFRSILRQEVGWFDKPANSSGQLTAKLAENASSVRGAIGDVLGSVAQNLFCLAIGYGIALAYSWRIALVVTALLPVMVSGSALYFADVMRQMQGGGEKRYAAANQAASDAFASIRTVHAYNLHGHVLRLYGRLTRPFIRQMLWQAQKTGLLLGFSQFTLFCVYSLIIWYGGKQIRDGRVNFDGMLKAFLAVMLAGMGLAHAQFAFPELTRAKVAVQKVFPIIDRRPAIDPEDPRGEELPAVSGHVSLESVRFAYPSRPTVAVFANFSLDVPAGQTVALVGESGSGKSTVVGLIERFYDPQQGRVLLDGVDIMTLRLSWLRQQIGLVSQEPALFATTIYENIRYGKPEATMDEVVDAAKAANAHDFITTLPNKFHTEVGEQGIQLSGGQKQRIAIARAVVKNPRIMLLDEATSALDAQAEAVVQAALDQIMVGRTSVVVAHRLSTIQRAASIAMVHRGSIVEQGTHDELLKIPGGSYARLVAAQLGGSGGDSSRRGVH